MSKWYRFTRSLFCWLIVCGCLLFGTMHPRWTPIAFAFSTDARHEVAGHEEEQLATASDSLSVAVDRLMTDQLEDNGAMQDVITGRVWKDSNWDGLYQINEPFIPYTLVTLYQKAAQSPSSTMQGTPILTTTTTLDGWYSFTGLAPGVYFLDFETPGAMFPTLNNQGTSETIDSDILYVGKGFKGRYASIMVTNTGQQATIDAGFVPSAQIVVYVYEDTNQDQQRQMGEPIVPGAVVILHDSTEEEIARRVVDGKGAAEFTDLLPGQYAIEVWPPEDYRTNSSTLLALPHLLPGANIRFAAPVSHAPKSISLIEFRVGLQDNALSFQWTTAAEYNTYGYRLVRRDAVTSATTVQLTPDLIPSQGHAGGVYAMQLPYNPAYDGPYATMEFWLVEYEQGGNQHLYGPFHVVEPSMIRQFLPLIVQ